MMQDTRVFGIVPKNIAEKTTVKTVQVPKWRFVDRHDVDYEIGPDEADEFVTEIPAEHLEEFKQEVNKTRSGAQEMEEISVDMPLIALGTSGRSSVQLSAFGTRKNALDLLGLEQQLDAGDDIGVVILDAGFNRDYIKSIAGPGRYGGGWSNQPPAQSQVGRFVDPHVRAEDIHSNMIARNILSIASKVTVYDAPILPPRVFSLKGFSSDVVGALRGIRRVILNDHGNPNFPTHKHWILVNAWAVATRFADFGQTYSYASDRQHRLNRQIISLANMDNVDVVFAAGNAGAYRPAPFAGPYDRGHEHSIWGANGLEEVFTIGAVRADSIAIGMSSQGPSLGSLTANGNSAHNKKPELCTPSWFSEDNDPSVMNTGTSTSCAVFAGVLARVRSEHPGTPSEDIKSKLISAAAGDGEWRAQSGYGVPNGLPVGVGAPLV